MGSKLEDVEFKKRNIAPGPGRYENDKLQTIPSMKFGTGNRVSLDGGKEAAFKPGPGNYDGNYKNLRTASPKFGFGSSQRGGSKLTMSVPGPGEYKPRPVTGAEGPLFSMGSTLEYSPQKKEQNFKPGPGNYRPDDSPVTKRASAWKMGSDVRRDLAFEKR